MDCAKLDAMAIDLVYDELDARAAADAEEHLLGCTRCSALVERLRAGRRGAESLRIESPSSLLEARILEAEVRSRRPAPWPRRLARAVSSAGAYAMRPQVAMAAVVLVMVGMSVVLLRGRGLTAHRTKVTDEGTPVASVESQKEEGAPAELVAADKAEKAKVAAAPAANAVGAPSPSTSTAEGGDGLARKADEVDLEKAKGKDDDLAAASPATPSGETKTATGGPGGAPADLGAAAADGKLAGPQPPAQAAGGGAAPAKKTAAAAEPSSPKFDAAMDAYGKAKFGEAASGFDAAAAEGTRAPTATLYAARSYRALADCTHALPRFQRVLSTWPASPEAPSAALEGGECARSLGDAPLARTLLERARTFPTTRARAEANLAAMDGPPQASMKAPAAKAAPKAAATSGSMP